MKVLELFAGSHSIGKAAEALGHEVFSIDIQDFKGIDLAKTDFAKKSDSLVKNTLVLIKHFDCIYYIENPRGMMRKMWFMQGLPRATVWYCTYGDTRAKPTDIWSNNIHNIFNQDGWYPRKECFNGNKYCHHEAAPRGSRTGTQGLKCAYTRSKIPKELCVEILVASEKIGKTA